MSREFGSYTTGYFHDQVATCADDALHGGYEITRKWGAVLYAMKGIAYSIASAEARDSLEADPIFKSMIDIQNVRLALEEIETYLEPFRQVVERASMSAISSHKTVNTIRKR